MIVQDAVAWCAAVDGRSGNSGSAVNPTLEGDPAAQVVVTLAGAYSSGKTSLIKRMLFELGAAVPSDLAVGVDPTTFTQRIDVAGPLALRDTPGLGSGNALHNERALDACADTDVLLLVMTPQLLSAADEDAWSLLTDEAWAAVAAPAADWRAVIINRFDMAGADPLEDQGTYQRLAQRKRLELVNSLESRSVRNTVVPIFVTAADPFGVVHDRTPEPGDYDLGQGWDGLPPLMDWLRELPEMLDTWRAQRAVRVRLRRLAQEQAAARRAMPELVLARSGAQESLHACQSYLRELTRLRAQLDAELGDALDSAVGRDSQAAAAPDRATLVRDRLAQAIQRWMQAHADRLAELASRAPEAIKIADLPDAVSDASLPESADASSEVLQLLKRVREHRDSIKETAAAFRILAADTPRLEAAKSWLSEEAVDAAISAIDLLWHLGKLDDDREEEAARRRRHYLTTAKQAAGRAAAPYERWMDRLTEDLQLLVSQNQAAHDHAVAAERQLSEAERICALAIAEAPQATRHF